MDAVDRLLKECQDHATPFALFACSNEPHTPHDKGDVSAYPAEDIELPPHYVDTPEVRTAFARYLAEITFFDDQVGQCLDLIRRHGLEESTLVMVVSEQGNSFPFAKWTCYDKGLQSGMVGSLARQGEGRGSNRGHGRICRCAAHISRCRRTPHPERSGWTVFSARAPGQRFLSQNSLFWTANQSRHSRWT